MPTVQHARSDRKPAFQSTMVPGVVPTRQDHTARKLRLDRLLPRRHAVAKAHCLSVHRSARRHRKSGQVVKVRWAMPMFSNVEATPTATGHPSFVGSVLHDYRRTVSTTPMQTTCKSLRRQVTSTATLRGRLDPERLKPKKGCNFLAEVKLRVMGPTGSFQIILCVGTRS